MSNFPDLSSLDVDVATDGLLSQMFVVHESAVKPWEQTIPDPSQLIELADGSWAHVWGEGPPVLLAHGYEGRYSQYARILEKFRGADFKLVALEMPGHGRAHALRADPLSFSRAIHAANTKFGSFHAMIGHSQGANAVLHAVSNGALSDSLVLIAPLVSVEAHLRQVCAMVKISPEGTELFLRKITALVGAPPSDFDGKVLRNSLAQPALIIHDREDREIPFSDAKELAAKWPSAHLQATNGLGHKRLLADTGIVDMVFSFLNDTAIEGVTLK